MLATRQFSLGFHKSSQKIASEDNYSRNAFSPISTRDSDQVLNWHTLVLKQQKKKMKVEKKESWQCKSKKCWSVALYYSVSLGIKGTFMRSFLKRICWTRLGATGNLDFTGFLGLKKYLWYGDKSGNESSIKMSTEFCKNLIDDKWLLQFLSCYRMPYLLTYFDRMNAF